MNSKTARAIRKSLENNGVNVKQVAYQTKNFGRSVFNPDGSLFVRTVTTKRVDGCGRSIYQQAKRNVVSAV